MDTIHNLLEKNPDVLVSLIDSIVEKDPSILAKLVKEEKRIDPPCFAICSLTPPDRPDSAYTLKFNATSDGGNRCHYEAMTYYVFAGSEEEARAVGEAFLEKYNS